MQLLVILFLILITIFYTGVSILVMKQLIAIIAEPKTYTHVLKAYNDMQVARKAFYRTRFEKDEARKQSIQRKARIIYDASVEYLDSPSTLEEVNKLPDDLKEEALNIINSPRYGLF